MGSVTPSRWSSEETWVRDRQLDTYHVTCLLTIILVTGRILVATRHIRRGELIFKERPAVVGPYSRTRPQCLTCFRTFDQHHVYTCSG